MLFKVNGVSLHYEVTGEGPAILLIPGWTGSTQSWGELLPRLAHELAVVTLDPRGAGATHTRDPFTLEDVAEDIAALLRHVDLVPAAVLGHAWGGRVAQIVAARHPDLVRGLVLVASGGIFPFTEQGAQAMRRLRDASLSHDERFASVRDAFFGARTLAENPQLIERWATRPGLAPTPPEGDGPSGTSLQSRAAQATDLQAYWGKAQCPTLLCYGTDDQIATPVHAEDLARRIDKSSLVWFEGAGHALPQEQPSELASYIIAFVRSLP
ncbi:MAG: alpha/beta hydrolase [Dehalococcoidia bacterium]